MTATYHQENPPVKLILVPRGCALRSASLEVREGPVPLLPAHWAYGTPHPSGFAHGMTPGRADRGDFVQDMLRQLFNAIESLSVVAQSIGRQCGEPESEFGYLFRELVHIGSLTDGIGLSIPSVSFPGSRASSPFG